MLTLPIYGGQDDRLPAMAPLYRRMVEWVDERTKRLSLRVNLNFYENSSSRNRIRGFVDGDVVGAASLGGSSGCSCCKDYTL